MSNKKGFSLIEIVVVLIIIGILAIIAVPIYSNYVQQGAATAAQNNLVTIYGAQRAYYLGTGSGAYYSSNGNTNDEVNINSTLNLNITDTNFNYTCSTTTTPPTFTCTATNIIDTHLILTVNGAASNNPPIVLQEGTGCTSTTTSSVGTCNPTCSDQAPGYCPT